MTAPAVVRIPADDFVRDYLDVRAGEHISLIGPTGTGKTTLGMKIIPEVLAQNPEMRAVVLAMKPHKKGKPTLLRRRKTGDETLARYARKHKAKIIRTWPQHSLFRKQRLFILWPAHQFDDYDEDRHADIFRECLADTYRDGDWLVFGDEAYSLCAELGLNKSMVRFWTKGRSMDASMMAATQKPTHVPLWMYSQASHLLLWHDPDKKSRERYAEIGGWDRRVIESALYGLDTHSCLYLRRRDRTMCIVSAQ